MAEKWLVIDAHTHFLPEEAIKKALDSKLDMASLTIGRIPATIQKTKEIENMLRIMEDGGIDISLINSSQWNQLGLPICRELNNGYARIKRTYPDKFLLCGHVPLKPGQEVLNEVDRCISELGLNAMALLASSPDYTMDAPELMPLYGKISELGVPIIIHPTIAKSIWGGGLKYELRSTVSREYEIAKCVCEVMFGVLTQFPDLKFVISHYGGGMPGLKGRIRAWYQPDGWPIPDNEECNNNGKSPNELDKWGLSQSFDKLFDKLYFDMAGQGAGWTPMLNAGLAMLRTDRMCFGTDYPFDVRVSGDVKYFIDAIKALNIPDHDKQLMLGGNLKKLFKI
jgi:predicted TIM-barrel fold metal-dependent hydrolase